MYVYRVFDSDPQSDPDSVLSSFEDVEINCRSSDAALDAALKAARAEGRTCGSYRPSETLYVLVWDQDGEIVNRGSVTLGGPGRPAANWRPPKCPHPREVRDASSASSFDALKRGADHIGAFRTETGRWAFFGALNDKGGGSWWTVSETDIEVLGADLYQKGPKALKDWTAKIEATPLHPSTP